MPRRPRVFVDGAIYHVFCRVGRGEPVFRDGAEADAFVDVLREVQRRDGLTVFAWCLMSNHYHLAVRTAHVPLWRTMRLVQGRFAKAYNRRHEVYGALWQGRYKATLVRDGNHLRQLIAYVHLNPVVAGVVKDPAHHRMSGHREILGMKRDEGLVDVPEALLPFGESGEAALRAYVHMLQAVARSRWAGGHLEHLPWWQMRSPLLDIQLIEGKPRLDALGASSEAEAPPVSLDDFVVAAAGALDVGLTQLAGPRSGREITRGREMMALLGVERYRFRVTDLAIRLGRNPGVVSRWVSMAGQRRMSDEMFRERLEQFTANLRAQMTPSYREESEFVSGADGAFVD